jgi:hypothetical protein
VNQAPESRLTRLENLLLWIAVAAYFAMSCVVAQIRMLWYDEIFTRQVAILGSWNRIVTALRHGIDLQPPLFYYVTYWARAIGSEEIGIRLPAMIGFSFTAFALYRVARRWFSPGYAIGVAITPAIFFFQDLGLEARPYGWVLGGASLALLGWSFRDRHPLAGRVAYLAGVLAAASAHYYAYTIAIPYGIAALWTLLRNRRLDYWTLAGCVFAVVPNLLNLDLIRAAIGIYKNGAWNFPSWKTLFASAYGWALGVLAVVFVTYLVRRKRSVSRPNSPPEEFLVCWLGFIFIPIFAMCMAKVSSGLFTLRYFAMFTLGYSLLLAYLLDRASKGSRRIGYFAGGAALAIFAVVLAQSVKRFSYERNVIASACEHFNDIFQRTEFRDSLLLVGDSHVAFQLGQYCEDVRPRIVVASDLQRQLAYVGSNTDAKAMLFLRESPPFRIVELDDFLRTEKHRLLIYHSPFSFMREFLTSDPEYASRVHVLSDDELTALYWMDPK